MLERQFEAAFGPLEDEIGQLPDAIREREIGGEGLRGETAPAEFTGRHVTDGYEGRPNQGRPGGGGVSPWRDHQTGVTGQGWWAGPGKVVQPVGGGATEAGTELVPIKAGAEAGELEHVRGDIESRFRQGQFTAEGSGL